jgi:thiamine pyrophosphokinase
LVLGDGDPPTRAGLDAAWPGWDDAVALVVAADGGARLAGSLGVDVDIWVGDGDSLTATEIDALASGRTRIERVPAAKDESDLELAVARALEAGCTQITVLGALGGPRLDHELANVLLLAHPAATGVGACVELVDARARVSLVTAPGVDGRPVRRELPGRVGDLVSLLPLAGDVDGVTTHGLRYPLGDEPLVVGPARGLSNVRLAPDAAVTVRAGRLLVVETPATLDS